MATCVSGKKRKVNETVEKIRMGHFCTVLVIRGQCTSSDA
jgi:hypothetical protein